MPSDKLNIQQGVRHEVSKPWPLNLGTNGQHWAEEFIKLLESVPLTVDLANTWFSNAIMMGYDHGRKEIEPKQDTPSGNV